MLHSGAQVSDVLLEIVYFLAFLEQVEFALVVAGLDLHDSLFQLLDGVVATGNVFSLFSDSGLFEQQKVSLLFQTVLLCLYSLS